MDECLFANLYFPEFDNFEQTPVVLEMATACSSLVEGKSRYPSTTTPQLQMG
eukprot:m.12985 g.12985  ORF g.12985 m.12985 type:complete len:52 (+) comp9540_c0_seq1:27-182(+)